MLVSVPNGSIAYRVSIYQLCGVCRDLRQTQVLIDCRLLCEGVVGSWGFVH